MEEKSSGFGCFPVFCRENWFHWMICNSSCLCDSWCIPSKHDSQFVPLHHGLHRCIFHLGAYYPVPAHVSVHRDPISAQLFCHVLAVLKNKTSLCFPSFCPNFAIKLLHQTLPYFQIYFLPVDGSFAVSSASSFRSTPMWAWKITKNSFPQLRNWI